MTGRRGDFRDPPLLHDRYITEQVEDVYYGYTPGEEGEPIPDSERDAEGYDPLYHRDPGFEYDDRDPGDDFDEGPLGGGRDNVWGHHE